MKEIKPVHVMIMIILVLLSLAIVQWMTLPQSGPLPAKQLAAEADQPVELPVLPQIARYNSNAAPSFSEDLPPFKESTRQDLLKPEDPAVSDRKAEL